MEVFFKIHQNWEVCVHIFGYQAFLLLSRENLHEKVMKIEISFLAHGNNSNKVETNCLHKVDIPASCYWNEICSSSPGGLL